jgi:hypothetical protein
MIGHLHYLRRVRKTCQERIEPCRYRCCFGSGCFATEQRKTARGAASTWLFFVVVEPLEHRISAGEGMSMADNSLLKTAKTAGPARRPSDAARQAS